MSAFGSGDPSSICGQAQGNFLSHSYLNALSPTHSARMQAHPQDYLNAAAANQRIGEFQAGLADSLAMEGEFRTNPVTL